MLDSTPLRQLSRGSRVTLVTATAVTVVAGALKAAGLRPRSIAAIGITNQRETTLLWDRKSGRPLHPRAKL